MELITRQTRANQAAQRWHRQYGPRFPESTAFGDTEVIYQRLVALGPTPNPDDVDRIIGNDSWTRLGECDECDQQKSVLVQVGEEPDYESHTATICVDCLQAALALVNEAAVSGKAE